MEKNRVERTSKRVLRTSFGTFANFPSTIHGIAKAKFNDHPAKVQQTIVEAFHKLNDSSETYLISPSSRVGTYQGRVGFEIGIAQGTDFYNLTNEVTKNLCRAITSKKPYSRLDFIIIVTYHYKINGKENHLHFDYHQLRFSFNNDTLEIRLFHSKGTRRMSLNELTRRILTCINEEMKHQSLSSLTIKELKVL